jgi:hypothetical protein
VAELAGVVGFGQFWLNSDSVLREVNGVQTVFTTVPNGVPRAAGFAEAGLAFRYYAVPRNIRAEQPSIDPTAEVSFSYRRDERFKQPEGQTSVVFDSPQDRLVARLVIANIRVIDRRNASAPPLSFGFGVEHEFGLKKNGVPAATRLFFVGDLALLKALRGDR